MAKAGDCCPKPWLAEEGRYLSGCLSIPSTLCCLPMSCTVLAMVKSRQQEHGLSTPPAREVLHSSAVSMGTTILQVLFPCVFFCTLTSPFGRRGDESSYSIELWSFMDDKGCGGLWLGSSLESYLSVVNWGPGVLPFILGPVPCLFIIWTACVIVSKAY